jgi:hypothetical protein
VPFHKGLGYWAQAKDVVSKAMEQQISYGLTAQKFVPRIPGKLNLPKIK